MTHSFNSQKFRSKDGNCLLWGCATVAVVGIIGAIALVFAARDGLGVIRDKYTDDAPIELPVSELTEEERTALIERVDEFAELLNNDEATEALILNQDDINGLIQFHPELERFKDKVYITLDGEDVHGQISVPLDEIPGFGGRYFNGSARFDVELENGVAKIFILDATLKGEPVPEEFMTEIRHQNMASDIQQDEDIREGMSKLERIEVTDGQVIVTPKAVAETIIEADTLETEVNP